MEPPPSVPDDCTECGACCHGDGPRYLPVTGEDHFRLGDAAETLTEFIGNRCYMRLVEGRCIALRTRVQGKPYVCSVYAARPTLCRTLERGSPACLAVLERAYERARSTSSG
jgi:uncharacterized protein